MAIRTKAKWAGAGVAICSTFLMGLEGYEPVAKHERVDPPSVITWCYGRTNYDDNSVAPGTHFTKEQCKAFLEDDLQKYAAQAAKCVPGFYQMPPHRQASIASFDYNLGEGTLCKSSVARKLNSGDVRGACDAMLAYDRANGKVLLGLQRRREAERQLCLREN